MSDEAKKKAREYVDANLSWDLCESSKWDEVAAETYLAGYNQGQTDAWRWRKYPEEKPSCDMNCLCLAHFVGHPGHSFTEVIYYDHGEGGIWDTNYTITHWLPITLPEGER